jgi:hypothetical protein
MFHESEAFYYEYENTMLFRSVDNQLPDCKVATSEHYSVKLSRAWFITDNDIVPISQVLRDHGITPLMSCL